MIVFDTSGLPMLMIPI